MPSYKFKLIFSYLSLMFLSLILLPFQNIGHSETKSVPVVYYIPVEQAVERGLEAFIRRSIETAAEAGASHIVLEINTPGGAIDAAGNIAQLLRSTDIPITAYVVKNAISAGAYIALNCDQIVMAPSSTMGAAGVIDVNGNAADKKTQSYWISEMKAAAELNGRDPLYAIAMTDPSIDLPEYRAPKGEYLTLTEKEALEVGYAEAIAKDRKELLQFLNLENAIEKEMEVTFAEKIARFVTHPIVIPILLSIGSLGLVLELYSPGFGVPGIMGISALLLFFFGHYIAGFAGMESILLFLAGLVLISIEIFMPGFGIFGLLGIGAIICSMLLASFSTTKMIIAILIAVIVAAVGSFVMFKFFGNRGPLKKLVLTNATTTEEGYVANVNREDLIGKIGTALTPLRPSGTALIGNERLDVVTEGSYIDKEQKIQVVQTSGLKIVVREVND